jgi:alkanesulfonate monooxygenase SsuD/methylene tetrahydromethanopterin reductase-like flavin-dependent oxidoreductase (luciferase family)
VLEGRYILGIGAGAYPTDAAVRGVTDMSTNHKKMLEALEILQKVWAAEPFHHEGHFFEAGFPENDPDHELRDVRPFSNTVEIGVTGLSPSSPSMKFAGRNGYLPLSVYAGEAAVANHWDTYAQAAEEAGLTPDRSKFHVVRDVLVADTDEEARKLAVEGGMGHAWREYLLPTYKHLGLLGAMLPGVDVDSVDEDTLVNDVWIVGSPDTVAEKIADICDRTGGWGTTMIYGHDYLDDPKPWNQSLELLVSEVAPKLANA